MIVEKRDGSKQPFKFQKIEDAVYCAFKSVNINTFKEYKQKLREQEKSETPESFNEEIEQLRLAMEKVRAEAKRFSDKLKDLFANMNQDVTITVEEIQDIIETELIRRNKPAVAKSFILYRRERQEIRESKSDLIKDIKKALNASDVQNQNANVDEASFGGRQGEAARVVAKNDALKNRMSKISRKNHEDGFIYVHDLDSYSTGMHNCLTIPFDKLLRDGFSTRQTDVRGANSVNTAFQLVAVLFQLQSLQQFGGVSASHLDWTMIPYVRKSFYKHYNEVRDILPFVKQVEYDKETVENTEIDNELYRGKHWWNFIKRYVHWKATKLTKRETYQAVEGMYHNLNTLQSRSGNQLPFTSINYGTCTNASGRMVIKALLEVSLKGLGKHHKTSIFPCGIFQYMKGVNDKPGTPNYDMYRLALKSTAKRIYPNYANVDWSGNKGYDVNDPNTYFSTMGCRTANGYDINGFGQLKDGRGNICPVTIILPTLAIESKLKVDEENTNITEDIKEKYVEEFFNMLDKKLGEAKDMLLERFKHICSQSPASAKFMWENGTMAGYNPEEGVISALKHGTLALGQLGLAECLQILIGTDHTTKEGMDLAIKIESFIRKRADEYKQEYKLNFGVYYTPAENLCYTALKKFRTKYGVIPNVSDREYFTNSMHVPVWHDIDPFEKVKIESKLTGFSNAGCITYVELPSTAINNIDAVETIVNFMMENDIPYGAINFPLDCCNNCHAQGDFNGVCPECDSTDIDELRRVTGYLSTTKKHFNNGKQAECDDRVKHIKN